MKRIAYLGIPGSYSFIAAQKYFGGKINMKGAKSLRAVFEIIKKGACDAAVVPLENTTTGSIVETYDLLLDSKLSIVSEVILKIHHQLLVNNNQKELGEIELCYSHPQALSQCEDFFTRYPNMKPLFTSDTASAAKSVAIRKKSQEAAIASSDAAKIYGLKILAKNIEDNRKNLTRFILISSLPNKIGDKISVVFSVAHIPGSLFRALKAYAQNNLNLTKIESRPLYGNPWEYNFYVDFMINNKESRLQETLKEMKKNCHFLTILGRYNKGKIYEA